MAILIRIVLVMAAQGERVSDESCFECVLNANVRAGGRVGAGAADTQADKCGNGRRDKDARLSSEHGHIGQHRFL